LTFAPLAVPLQFLSPLHKATRQLSVHIERRLADLGMSPQEGHLLTYLNRYAPAPVGELVRVFGIKQSTLTSILDRLETAGYIQRTLNPDDRRSFLIHVTESGRALAEQSNARLEALEEEIRGRLSAEEVNAFEAVIRAIEEVTQVDLRG
jgi:DNA-binding MarR family transcriptional regulator